jgi:uncharacterized protein YneF (UPF0154 family)
MSYWAALSLLSLLFLVIGALAGNGFTTRKQHKRGKELARQQRVINEAWHALEAASGQNRAWWQARFRGQLPPETDEEDQDKE